MIIPLVYPISAWSKLANPSFLTPREKKVRRTCSTCHDSEFQLFFACSFSLYGSIISWFVYRFESPGFPSTWAPAYKIQIMLEAVLQCACQWVERNYWKRAKFVNSIDTFSVYRFWAHALTISWSIYSLLNIAWRMLQLTAQPPKYRTSTYSPAHPIAFGTLFFDPGNESPCNSDHLFSNYPLTSGCLLS